MPLLTSITTVYNDGPALMTSVRSILSQDFADFQMILIDDGSAGETVDLIGQIEDPRLLVIRQANDGLSAARNKALEQATGDYVCFLDADDSRPNWAFGAIAAKIASDQPDVILCPGVLQDLRGEPLAFYDQPIFDRLGELCPRGMTQRADPDFWALRVLAQRCEPQAANKVLRRAFLSQTGMGFPNGHFFEDIYFHTGVIALADRISFLDSPAFCYFRRYQRPQITATNGEMRFDAIAVCRLTLDSFARRPEFTDPGYRHAVLASCLRIVGWCHRKIAHSQRPGFQLACRAMLRLIDPAYLPHLWQAAGPAGDRDIHAFLAEVMA